MSQDNKTVAVIPARMGSSRFPGKPLERIAGISMIEHVRIRTEMCDLFDEVVVATCDDAIREEVENGGGRAVMTSDSHETCLDRVAEAVDAIGASIVINVQGDMPLVRPDMLGDLVSPLLADDSLLCTDLIGPVVLEEEFVSPNVVKATFDLNFNAICYSREPIPSRSKAAPDQSIPMFKQMGIMAFRTEFLKTFTGLPRTPLERVESVDMLRVLEHGYKIRFVRTDHPLVGVDVPDDIRRAEELMLVDDLYAGYGK